MGLLARSQPELDLAKLEIEHAGGAALRIRADVRDFEQICAAVDRMRAVFGGVHVLIAAAAMQGPIAPFGGDQAETVCGDAEINVLGVMHACRAVLPPDDRTPQRQDHHSERSGGEEARPNFSAVAASKAAVVRLAETLAEEVRDQNVQVNALSPGETTPV